VTGLNPTTGSAATGATWSVPSYGTGLPPGLSLADGVISGTPTTEGAYTFRIQASLNGASHFQTYSLTVRQPLTLAASKPLATTPAPTLWETGVPFSAKLTPAGGNGTYTFAIADGALPTGLALAADGTLAGTPTVAGVSKATIRVTDGEGRTLDYPAGFGIAKRLAVSTLLLKPGKVGRAYHTRLSTTGGLPPKTWRAITGKLPRGVKLDRQLGVLSGVPTKAGTYKVTFQATDGLKVAATKTLKIVVLPASR
jgi:large repetitive protein